MHIEALFFIPSLFLGFWIDLYFSMFLRPTDIKRSKATINFGPFSLESLTAMNPDTLKKLRRSILLKTLSVGALIVGIGLLLALAFEPGTFTLILSMILQLGIALGFSIPYCKKAKSEIEQN